LVTCQAATTTCEPERTLHAGDTFHEPSDARIAHFGNASDVEPAVFVAFYPLPPGALRLIVAELDTGA
jgi:hypothetical protein